MNVSAFLTWFKAMNFNKRTFENDLNKVQPT